MKETITDLLNRRSVRNYKPDQITDEELMTGDIVKVQVTGAYEYDLIGEIIK